MVNRYLKFCFAPYTFLTFFLYFPDFTKVAKSLQNFNNFSPCQNRKSKVFDGLGLMDSAELCEFGSRPALVFGTRSSG